jgi:hypothetical protein
MKSDMTAIGAMSKSYEDDVVIPHDDRSSVLTTSD